MGVAIANMCEGLFFFVISDFISEVFSLNFAKEYLSEVMHTNITWKNIR